LPVESALPTQSTFCDRGVGISTALRRRGKHCPELSGPIFQQQCIAGMGSRYCAKTGVYAVVEATYIEG
jgi:hypothetical protein